jgi:hypothetical protein
MGLRPDNPRFPAKRRGGERRIRVDSADSLATKDSETAIGSKMKMI